MSLAAALEAALRAPPEGRDALVDAAVSALAEASASEIPAGVDARRALLICTYNVLTLHSVRGRGASVLSAWHRAAFVRYRIAGLRFTLDEIEHGLLRDNARPPYRLVRPFASGDPRLAWRVPLDPRVHFALNCGSVSCPPVRVYTGARLDQQLDAAERSFLGSETRVGDATRTIATSQLLEFYAADFGGREGMLRRIERAFDRAPGALSSYRLRFDRYDFRATIRFASE
ncbi:MAG: DUF547 domain-containing protein [Deltaproteobacteria bacterium]|nr:DUF547 domain-containing protein [Deltaproteobacteria bacterium]